MATGTPTHNAHQVIVTWAGIVMRERGKNEFLRIKRRSPAYTMTKGIDSAVREATNDDTADMEVILLATSSVNRELFMRHEADKASMNGAGIAPFSVVDLNSREELHFAEEAWIADVPEVTYERGVGERIWKFSTDNLRSFFGGH